jgi:hypothetical protein
MSKTINKVRQRDLAEDLISLIRFKKDVITMDDLEHSIVTAIKNIGTLSGTTAYDDNELRQRIKDIEDNYFTKNDYIIINNGNIEELNKKVEALENQSSNYRDKSTEITTNDIEANFTTRVDNLETRVNYLSTVGVDVAQVQQQVQNVISQMNLQSDILDAVKQDITNETGTKIDNLQKEVDVLDGRVTSLESKVSNDVRLKSDKIEEKDLDTALTLKLDNIQTNTDAISDLNDKISNLTGTTEYEVQEEDIDLSTCNSQVGYYIVNPSLCSDLPSDNAGLFNSYVSNSTDNVKYIVQHKYFDLVTNKTYERIGNPVTTTYYLWYYDDGSGNYEYCATASANVGVGDAVLDNSDFSSVIGTVSAYDAANNEITFNSTVYKSNGDTESTSYVWTKWICAEDRAVEDSAKETKADILSSILIGNYAIGSDAFNDNLFNNVNNIDNDKLYSYSAAGGGLSNISLDNSLHNAIMIINKEQKYVYMYMDADNIIKIC